MDVMSVTFSADNCQIVSGSPDKNNKVWNTLAQCKYTIQEDGHSDWIYCVRFFPNNQNPIMWCGSSPTASSRPTNPPILISTKLQNDPPYFINSGSWTNWQWIPKHSLYVTRWFPLGSGGKDTKAMIWDLNDDKHISSLYILKQQQLHQRDHRVYSSNLG